MKKELNMRSVGKGIVGAILACAMLLAGAGTASARPTYFEQFKAHYSVADGSNLDACGVCHYRWLGTGARNPFGTTVEQQLYVGKTILQSLVAVEDLDPDGDGFTSGDEIMNFMTLPGYNCENFILATGPPTGYDAYITPLVATCLDPLDIRVNPLSLGSFVYVGESRIMDLAVFNNGSTDPLEISSYGLLPGAHAALSVSGPTAPFSIPVGSNVTIQVTFSPLAAQLASGTLRISSNDPDEANVDVPISGAGVADPTSPPAQRGPCMATISKAMSKYAKAHLKEWGTCYLEELAGRACDTGTRNYKLGRAAAKLADVIGGAKDKTCGAAGLNPQELGFPGTCAEGCESIALNDIDDLPTCLTCMQDRVMEGMLRDGVGTAPPDLPPNVIADASAYKCQKRIVGAMQKGIVKMFGELAECELTAMLLDAPGGVCRDDLDALLDSMRVKIDATVDKCMDTTDLLGCRFEGMSPDPACLGTSVEDLAVELTNTSFALYTP